ncbi:MAG: sugar-binding protein [Frankiales bacterium]|nr:sugar-binding protein [Frankiales bacterium]
MRDVPGVEAPRLLLWSLPGARTAAQRPPGAVGLDSRKESPHTRPRGRCSARPGRPGRACRREPAGAARLTLMTAHPAAAPRAVVGAWAGPSSAAQGQRAAVGVDGLSGRQGVEHGRSCSRNSRRAPGPHGPGAGRGSGVHCCRSASVNGGVAAVGRGGRLCCGKQRSGDALGGVVLMGVRLYSPVLGRFLQVDPIPGGSANAYDYINADPINNFDLDGRWCGPRCRWNKAKRYLGSHDWGVRRGNREHRLRKLQGLHRCTPLRGRCSGDGIALGASRSAWGGVRRQSDVHWFCPGRAGLSSDSTRHATLHVALWSERQPHAGSEGRAAKPAASSPVV